MIDLDYAPLSLCGPADMRVARFLEEYRGNKLDPSYLLHIQRWHGGIPGRQYFDAADGNTYRVGRFLSIVNKKSELDPPFRPSWKYPERDVRIDWSVLTLIDEEGPTSRALFSGEAVLPFAALFWGPEHPDKMDLAEGNVDLLVFLYETNARPQVVVWLADAAPAELFRLEDADPNEERRIRYENFTVPVARDFDAFLALLRAEPQKRGHSPP